MKEYGAVHAAWWSTTTSAINDAYLVWLDYEQSASHQLTRCRPNYIHSASASWCGWIRSTINDDQRWRRCKRLGLGSAGVRAQGNKRSMTRRDPDPHGTRLPTLDDTRDILSGSVLTHVPWA